MFRFNEVKLLLTVEDFSKIFKIPYRGAYMEVKADKNDNEFTKKFFIGKALQRYFVNVFSIYL